MSAIERLKEIFATSKCKIMYIIFVAISLVIVLYFLVMNFVVSDGDIETVDVMNKTVFVFDDKPYSWWPVSHYLFFFIIGFYFPRCAIPAIVGGVLWEIVELIVGAVYSMRPPKEKENGDLEYNVWWAASYVDVIMNVLGFYSGMIARLAFDYFDTDKAGSLRE